jgi:RNA polymerase sigma factor (sigma-70 family)
MGYDDAFGAIHDRYRTRLLAYARQMLGGSGSDAEDALQDVFLRAYHALRADDRPVTLRAWLYRVAHNRCIDHLRRPASQCCELPENVRALHGSDGADPHADAERHDDLRRLVADIGRLPQQQRSALLMREMEGLSYHELGDALEVTVPAVKSLLVRARLGLVEAQEARDTACCEIRSDLASAHDRGVRASGRARRHLRECADCRQYRVALKGVRSGLAALTPAPGGSWATVAKLFGLGSAGSAAGGGAAVSGGGVAAGGISVGSSAVATKVVAVMCCAAVVGGGAAEVTKHVERHTAAPATRAANAHGHVAGPSDAALRRRSAGALIPHAASGRARSGVAIRRGGAKRHHQPDILSGPMTSWRFGRAPHDPGTPIVDRVAADRAGGVLGPEEDVAATGMGATSSTTGAAGAATTTSGAGAALSTGPTGSSGTPVTGSAGTTGAAAPSGGAGSSTAGSLPATTPPSSSASASSSSSSSSSSSTSSSSTASGTAPGGHSSTPTSPAPSGSAAQAGDGTQAYGSGAGTASTGGIAPGR